MPPPQNLNMPVVGFLTERPTRNRKPSQIQNSESSTLPGPGNATCINPLNFHRVSSHPQHLPPNRQPRTFKILEGRTLYKVVALTG